MDSFQRVSRTKLRVHSSTVEDFLLLFFPKHSVHLILHQKKRKRRRKKERLPERNCVNQGTAIQSSLHFSIRSLLQSSVSPHHQLFIPVFCLFLPLNERGIFCENSPKVHIGTTNLVGNWEECSIPFSGKELIFVPS